MLALRWCVRGNLGRCVRRVEVVPRHPLLNYRFYSTTIPEESKGNRKQEEQKGVNGIKEEQQKRKEEHTKEEKRKEAEGKVDEGKQAKGKEEKGKEEQKIKWHVTGTSDWSQADDIFNAAYQGDNDYILAHIDAVGDKRDKENRSYLHYAAKGGKVNTIELLIQKGISVHSVDSHLQTPLFYAVVESHFAAAKCLLDNGASPLAKERMGRTPLSFVNDTEMIDLLLQRGAKIEERDNQGETPIAHFSSLAILRHFISRGANVNVMAYDTPLLHLVVVMVRDTEVVKHLVDAGANKDRLDKGISALHCAVEIADLPIVSLLLSSGARVDVPHAIYSPLFTAAKSGQAEILRLLLKKGGDVNQKRKKETVLFSAVRGKSIECVKAVVEAGALNFDEPEFFGLSPLTAAMAIGELPIARYLLQKAYPNTNVDEIDPIKYLEKDKKLEYPLLHTAALMGNVEMIETIKRKRNVDLDEVVKGHTLLKMAVRGDSLHSIQPLLKLGATLNSPRHNLLHLVAVTYPSFIEPLVMMGADVNQMSTGYTVEGSLTPLHLTAIADKPEGLQELISAGANPSIPSSTGELPLMCASSLPAMRMMLDAGADPAAGDAQGFTALMRYSMFGHLELVKKLIERKVNVDQRNKRGSTAYLVALSYGHAEVAHALVRAGADKHACFERCYSPLVVAIHGHRPDIIRELVSTIGLDINQVLEGGHGVTVAFLGTAETYPMLTELGANYNLGESEGQKLVHFKVRMNKLEEVKMIVKGGARVDVKNSDGLTPRELAVKLGFGHIAEYLKGVEKGTLK